MQLTQNTQLIQDDEKNLQHQARDRSFTFNGVRIEFVKGMWDREWSLYIDRGMRSEGHSEVSLYTVTKNDKNINFQVGYASSHFTLEETYTHLKNLNTALELQRAWNQVEPQLEQFEANYHADMEEVRNLYFRKANA